MAVTIKNTEKNTVAHRLNLSGCTLISINGNEINDMFDYEFHTKNKTLDLVFVKDGIQTETSIKKDEYQPFGCEFETYLIDKKHTCKNKCVFCFVDQIPKGLRSDLYFKDDDERLSFLFGNYITLTNLTQKEIKRIINMNISPVNISVHTVDAKLRVEMMKNPHAGEVLSFIDELNSAGIKMNFQLVLCPDINDGEKLIESLEKLGSYYPNVQSIAAVPVGLTKYRQNLAPLTAYSEKSAKKQLEIMLKYGEFFMQKFGTRLIYPSDEWFILSKTPLPNIEFYEDFPQIENGVGMWRMFCDEFIEEMEFQSAPLLPQNFDLVTGEITSELSAELCTILHKKFPNVTVKVHTVKNNFFGGNVNVTGLLTSADIIAQLKTELSSKTLLLPENILRDDSDLLLDNVSVDEIARELNVNIIILPQNGAEALCVMLGNKL